MPADGYLVLGAAETVVGLTDLMKPVRRQARALCAERARRVRRARGRRAVVKFAAKA